MRSHAAAALFGAVRPHFSGVIPQSQPSLEMLIRNMPPELISVQPPPWDPSAVPIDIPIVVPPPVEPVAMPEIEGVVEVDGVAKVIEAVLAIFGG